MNKIMLTILTITFLNLFAQELNAQNLAGKSEPSSSSVSPRTFQVSFIPFFGTNGMQSGNYINNVSFNILAGYNGGTSGFELGGLVNIDKYEVSATQIAGIGNHGGQTTDGAQIAGIYNISRVMTGTQIAGISNITTSMKGVQIAGISNQTLSGSCGQIGGIVNLSGEKAIFQLGGLVNYAQSCKGTQVAGLLNVTEKAVGSQISGIVNIARTVKGSQIGVINIADTCNGIALGVINIIRNGYQRFEISADEFFQANLAYRSGTEKIHTILTAGIKPGTLEAPLWVYGVGLGTSQPISANTLLDFDATFNHVIKKAEAGNNYLYKAYLGIDRSLGNHLSLAVGISYNFLVADKRDHEYGRYYSDIAPYSFSENENNRFNLKSWAGIKLGLRFR